MDYPRLSMDLDAQLKQVQRSFDGTCEYAPCQVTLRSGDIVDRVYVVEAESYRRAWGIKPQEDPGKDSVSLEEVIALRESPSRLAAHLANKVYSAGESGMGYSLFVVVMRDGTRLPFVVGNAVDFPAWPSGVDPRDAVDVEPHAGRDLFRDRAPGPSERSASYSWCLYSV